jgi:hypothetical protein
VVASVVPAFLQEVYRNLTEVPCRMTEAPLPELAEPFLLPLAAPFPASLVPAVDPLPVGQASRVVRASPVGQASPVLPALPAEQAWPEPQELQAPERHLGSRVLRILQRRSSQRFDRLRHRRARTFLHRASTGPEQFVELLPVLQEPQACLASPVVPAPEALLGGPDLP